MIKIRTFYQDFRSEKVSGTGSAPHIRIKVRIRDLDQNQGSTTQIRIRIKMRTFDQELGSGP